MVRASFRDPLEKGIEGRVVAYAKGRGWKSLKVKFVETGYPDRLFILPARIVFIEFKRPGKEPTTLQNHRLLELLGYHIPATWTDNYDDAVGFLEEQAKLGAETISRESNSTPPESGGGGTVP